MTYGMVSMNERCVALKRYIPRRFSTASTFAFGSYASMDMLKHVLLVRYTMSLEMATNKL
jgi:hypothetical protein